MNNNAADEAELKRATKRGLLHNLRQVEQDRTEERRLNRFLVATVVALVIAMASLIIAAIFYYYHDGETTTAATTNLMVMDHHDQIAKLSREQDIAYLCTITNEDYQHRNWMHHPLGSGSVGAAQNGPAIIMPRTFYEALGLPATGGRPGLVTLAVDQARRAAADPAEPAYADAGGITGTSSEKVVALDRMLGAAIERIILAGDGPQQQQQQQQHMVSRGALYQMVKVLKSVRLSTVYDEVFMQDVPPSDLVSSKWPGKRQKDLLDRRLEWVERICGGGVKAGRG